MLTPINTKQFKKDLKKFEHKKIILEELFKVIEYLLNEQPLPESYRDHSLIGNWVGRKECHVKSDIVLIYKIVQESKEIVFERIGSHSEVLKI